MTIIPADPRSRCPGIHARAFLVARSAVAIVIAVAALACGTVAQQARPCEEVVEEWESVLTEARTGSWDPFQDEEWSGDEEMFAEAFASMDSRAECFTDEQRAWVQPLRDMLDL